MLDLQRQPLGDGGLADPGLADVQRVVLATAAEDLDRPLELRGAADDRIDVPLLRPLEQVHGEALQRISRRRGAFVVGADAGRLVRRSVFRDAVGEVGEDVDLGDALAAEQVDRVRLLGLEDGGEHLAGVDLLAARALGVELRVLNHALQHRRQRGLNVLLLDLFVGLGDEVVELLLELLDVAAARADDVDDVAVVQQREQQVLEGDVLVPPADGLVDGELETGLESFCDHGGVVLSAEC